MGKRLVDSQFVINKTIKRAIRSPTRLLFGPDQIGFYDQEFKNLLSEIEDLENLNELKEKLRAKANLIECGDLIAIPNVVTESDVKHKLLTKKWSI